MAQLDLGLSLNAYLFSGIYELKAKPWAPNVPLTAGEILRYWLTESRPKKPNKPDAFDTGLDPDTEVACVATWPKGRYFGVFLSSKGASSSNKPQDHNGLMREVTGQTDHGKVIDEGFEQDFTSLKAAANAPLELTVRVDTGNPALLKWKREVLAPDAPAEMREGLELQITLEIYVPNKKEAAATLEIPLRIIPGKTAPVYKGIITLDLGNTRSVLLCRDRREDVHAVTGASGLASRLQLIPLEPDTFEKTANQHEQPEVYSGLRIAALPVPKWSSEKHLRKYCKANYVVGDKSLEGGDDGLILSPKRLLADPRKDREHVFSIDEKPTTLPKNVPAELFIVRLLQKFVRAKKKTPEKLCVTHPTTYGPQEIMALKLAIYSALRQAAGEADRPDASSVENLRSLKKAIDEKVPKPLDEASAAASYLLFRDYVEKPGAVRAFMDRYPNGQYVLVFDCGGGTTDITLVHAAGEKIPHETGSDSQKKDLLAFRITTLERTGNRNFGGDEITFAVYLLIKAKLALAAADPGSKEQIEKLIANPPKPFNDLNDFDAWKVLSPWLQTEWMKKSTDPNVVADPIEDLSDVPTRRRIVLDLWNLAERVKRRLSKATDSVTLVDTGPERSQAADSDWNNLFEVIKLRLQAQNAEIDIQDIEDNVRAITISRSEVDRMIRPMLDETVDRINRMIRQLCVKPEHEGFIIGRIYLVGNASRYPLIRETLENKLETLLAKEFIQSEDLETKSAVAKGACIQAWLREDQENIRWIADPLDSLPYDVVLRDVATRTAEEIFPRGTVFTQQNNSKLIYPAQITGTAIALCRRWPGDSDDQIADFMVFRFYRGPEGSKVETVPASPVRVTFNLDKQVYEMVDKNGIRGVAMPVSESQFVPYVQSGRI